MVDEELSKLLDRIAKRIIERKSENVESLELDMVRVDSPNGIYIYDKKKDKWVLIRTGGGYYIPEKDGIYVIYFDNTRCPACRMYDLSWYTYIRLFGKDLEDVNFVIVLCDWFARKCRSEAAKKTFEHYDIHASPTTVLLYVKNGKVVLEDKFEGAKKLDYLASKIDEFTRKARKGNT